MEKLSSNLSLKEVIKSNTAKRKGIDNTPNSEHLGNLKVLAIRVFQPIREHFETPIGISSGYRSEALNKAIGGSKTSQHSRGQALDLDADIYGGLTNFDIFFFIKNTLDFDQLIWEFGTDEEPNWVHVSFRADGKNRKSVLKAIRSNGRTKYLKNQ